MDKKGIKVLKGIRLWYSQRFATAKKWKGRSGKKKKDFTCIIALSKVMKTNRKVTGTNLWRRTELEVCRVRTV